MGKAQLSAAAERTSVCGQGLVLVGSSPAMVELKTRLQAVSRRDHAVLLHGESGSGKEMVARSIHAASRRHDGPFIVVDCSTLRDTLFESQLFGHVRGAFTGAEQSTLGFFRSADGGTLFLDEIGELPLPIQAKLLRCIQEGAVIPLGGVKPIPVDVRIVAATHRDLRRMVRDGTFREDLYYRLNVVRLTVPPLRERRGDILALANHFLDQQAALYREPRRTLSTEAAAALEAYFWPGNVRELANAIEHACAFAEGTTISLADLPETVRQAVEETQLIDPDQILTLEAAERLAISRALQAANGNRAKAAVLLKIERHRLYRKIRRYRLENVGTTLAG